MKLRRQNKEPLIEILDQESLAELLRDFEDEHREATGERLTTAEFYDRYRAGEADGVAEAIRWASYYELYRAQGQQALGRKKSRGGSLVSA